MTNLVAFDIKKVVIKGGIDKILGIIGTLAENNEINPDAAKGQVVPTARAILIDGLIKRIKGYIEAVVHIKVGARERELLAFDVYLDAPAYDIWKKFLSYMNEMLNTAFNAQHGVTAAVAEVIESRFVLIYHIILRLAAVALCNDMASHRDGEKVLQVIESFRLALLKDPQLLIGSMFRDTQQFKLYLATTMPKWINLLRAVVGTIKVLHAPEKAFTNTLTHLNNLERRIMRVLCAKLNLGAVSASYDDLQVSDTLLRCETSILKGIKADKPKHTKEWLATLDPRALEQATPAEEKQIAIIGTFKDAKDRLDLAQFYSILNETRMISGYVNNQDILITAVQWAAILTGVINIRELISLLESHWRRCAEILEIPLESSILKNNTQVQNALMQYNALGPLSKPTSFIDASAWGLKVLLDPGIINSILAIISNTMNASHGFRKEFNKPTFFDAYCPGKRAKIGPDYKSAQMLVKEVSENDQKGANRGARLQILDSASRQRATLEPLRIEWPSSSSVRIEEIEMTEQEKVKRKLVTVTASQQIEIAWEYYPQGTMSQYQSVLDAIAIEKSSSLIKAALVGYSEAEGRIEEKDAFDVHYDAYCSLDAELKKFQTANERSGNDLQLGFVFHFRAELAHRQVKLLAFLYAGNFITKEEMLKHKGKLKEKFSRSIKDGVQEKDPQKQKYKQAIYDLAKTLESSEELKPENLGSSKKTTTLRLPQEELVRHARYLEAKNRWDKIELVKDLLFERLKNAVLNGQLTELKGFMRDVLWDTKSKERSRSYRSLYEEFSKEQIKMEIQIWKAALAEVTHWREETQAEEKDAYRSALGRFDAAVQEIMGQRFLESDRLSTLTAALTDDFLSLLPADDFYSIFTELNPEEKEESVTRYNEIYNFRKPTCASMLEGLDLDRNAYFEGIIAVARQLFNATKGRIQLAQILLGFFRARIKEAEAQLEEANRNYTSASTAQTPLNSTRLTQYFEAWLQRQKVHNPNYTQEGPSERYISTLAVNSEEPDDLIADALCCPFRDVPLSYLKDEEGNTLMHYAMQNYKMASKKKEKELCIQIIELLYQNGADMVTVNKDGKNAYTFAGFLGMKQIEEMKADENRKVWKLKTLEAKYVFSWSLLTEETKQKLLQYTATRSRYIENNQLRVWIKKIFGNRMMTHDRLVRVDALLRETSETYRYLDEEKLLEQLEAAFGDENSSENTSSSRVRSRSALQVLTKDLSTKSRVGDLLRVSASMAKDEEIKRLQNEREKHRESKQQDVENIEKDNEVAASEKEKDKEAIKIAEKQIAEATKQAADSAKQAADSAKQAAEEKAAREVLEQENERLRKKIEDLERQQNQEEPAPKPGANPHSPRGGQGFFQPPKPDPRPVPPIAAAVAGAAGAAPNRAPPPIPVRR